MCYALFAYLFSWKGYATPDTQAVGMARLGQPDQLVRAVVCLLVIYRQIILFLLCLQLFFESVLS